jgi:hypothetical protein
MPSAKKKPSVKNLRRRMKNNKKIKKKAEEDEKIQSFEAFQKKLQEEREEDARRRDIHDPMDDEKLVKKLMEEAEKEKKNRMNIANNGGRDRPVELFSTDLFYDRDYCAIFILLFFLDMSISLFQLYCALDGFGFDKFFEEMEISGASSNTRSRRNKGEIRSEIQKHRITIMKGYQSLVRLLLYGAYYCKWFTWIVSIIEMVFRYMFLSSTGIPILIDLTVGSFIAYFYNKPLIHLFRLYNIFLRLYFIHKDELDIAVGAVEVKLDKCLKKLNKQKKIIKETDITIEKQEEKIKKSNSEIATLQQALYYAAKSAEDDTEYFFKALNDIGAFTPEAMDNIKNSLNNPEVVAETLKNHSQKKGNKIKSSNNSEKDNSHHGHSHSHSHNDHHGHSHGDSHAKEPSIAPVSKGEVKRKFKIQSDGKMLEKK